MNPIEAFDELLCNYPALNAIRDDIMKGYHILESTYTNGGKVLVCGNGGSASDCEHIVGELMKGFRLERPCNLIEGARLQHGLPAISLVSQSSLISAISNDNGADLVFAQQVIGYGSKGDTLIGISTSGNSRNVVLAIEVASRLGLNTIGLTGISGGKLDAITNVCIKVPESETYKVQELHLPIYHALCSMLEFRFFDE